MRIVIADDAVLLRAGLERLLTDAGHEVVAAVGDAAGLLAAVSHHRPDLAVIDVRMPPTFTDEGVRAAVLIRQQDPEVALLVLSQYVEERYASDLIADSSPTSGRLVLIRPKVEPGLPADYEATVRHGFSDEAALKWRSEEHTS